MIKEVVVGRHKGGGFQRSGDKGFERDIFRQIFTSSGRISDKELTVEAKSMESKTEKPHNEGEDKNLGEKAEL